MRQKAQEWGEEARDVVGTVSDEARGWGEEAREAAEEMISEAEHGCRYDRPLISVAEQIYPDSAARDAVLGTLWQW